MLKKYLKNNAAFTLLEVIIAMSIMVITFAAILAVEGGAIKASARSKQLNVVAMLAKNQMVETEYLVEGKTFDEVEKEKEGTFEAPYQDYKWKRTIKELDFPQLSFGSGGKSSEDSSKGSGGGSSGGQGDQMAELLAKRISSFLSKAIREITVTITWQRGKGEQSYSVSTYWVDLNRELTISD